MYIHACVHACICTYIHTYIHTKEILLLCITRLDCNHVHLYLYLYIGYWHASTHTRHISMYSTSTATHRRGPGCGAILGVRSRDIAEDMSECILTRKLSFSNIRMLSWSNEPAQDLYICMFVQTYVWICIYACVKGWIYTGVTHVCGHMHEHTHIWQSQGCDYSYIHTHIHA